MKKRILLCCLTFIPAISGCTQTEAQESQGQASRQPRLTNVEVQTVHPSVLEEYLTLTGHTESMHDVILASELGGTVMKLHADRGDRVSRDQVLAKVSADMYEAQLAEAQANFRLKQASLKKAKTLYERGSISSMQRLQAQVEHDAAEANA
jgi:membrane fusion protein (multidrug efflux system)